MVFDYISAHFNILKKEDLSFPFDDAGFLYGYGLFESIRVIEYKTPLLDLHLSRLHRAAAQLLLPSPDIEKIRHHIPYLIKANGHLLKNAFYGSAVLNIYMTAGNKTEAWGQFDEPFLLMVLRPYQPFKPMMLDLCSSENRYLPGLKHLSWMSLLLSKKRHPDCDDILLHNTKAEILEGSKSSVFFIKKGKIFTPSLGDILPGVFRQHLLNTLKQTDFDCHESCIKVSDLNTMDEIFCVNAIHGMMPVKGVKGYPFLCSGPITQLLSSTYAPFHLLL